MNSHQLNAQIPYATDDELTFITDHCRTLTAQQTMVIIGAGPGVMLLAAREGEAVARHTAEFGLDFPILLIDHQTIQYAQAHLQMAGLEQHVMYMISDSSSVGKEWSGDVDFLIIDGDHSYEGVMKDMDAWLPHMAHHGTVFIHDYEAEGTRFANQERYPGTAQAVSDSHVLTLFKMVARPGTAIVLERLD